MLDIFHQEKKKILLRIVFNYNMFTKGFLYIGKRKKTFYLR